MKTTIYESYKILRNACHKLAQQWQAFNNFTIESAVRKASDSVPSKYRISTLINARESKQKLRYVRRERQIKKTVDNSNRAVIKGEFIVATIAAIYCQLRLISVVYRFTAKFLCGFIYQLTRYWDFKGRDERSMWILKCIYTPFMINSQEING